MDNREIPIILVVALAFATIPFLTGAYYTSLFVTTLFYATLAISMNIILGYVGYPSFGHAVFVGMGAYIMAILVTTGAKGFGMNPLLAFPLMILIVAGISLGLGLALLRLKSHYFAIATLGLILATSSIVTQFTALGGGSGWQLPLIGTTDFYFYLFLVLTFGGLLISYWIERSRIGVALRAIEIDDTAASMIGVHVVKYRTIAWVISACLAATVGGVYAFYLGFIGVGMVLIIRLSIIMIVSCMLGGLGIWYAPLIGAFIIGGLASWIGAAYPRLHLLIVGIMVVVVIVVIPKGIVGSIPKEKIKQFFSES